MGLNEPTVVHKPGELVIDYKKKVSGPGWKNELDQVKITVHFDCYKDVLGSDEKPTGVLQPTLPHNIGLVVHSDIGAITPTGIETGPKELNVLDLAQTIYNRSAMARG